MLDQGQVDADGGGYDAAKRLLVGIFKWNYPG